MVAKKGGQLVIVRLTSIEEIFYILLQKQIGRSKIVIDRKSITI